MKDATSTPRLSSYRTRPSDRLSILHDCLPIVLSSALNSFLDHRPYYTLLQTNTSNNSVIINETFSITCTADANPPAKHVIYRDETRIVGNNSVVTSSVTERVKRVTFTCKPSNFYGIGQIADVSLDVLCKWNCFDYVWYAFTHNHIYSEMWLHSPREIRVQLRLVCAVCQWIFQFFFSFFPFCMFFFRG